ncbi:tyrosine recombinase XerC [Alcaligenes sp. SDU_A2]|uniref:tyrosine recombinase XerC n=1 Tax=Alcaligenes sp. SDU_A2 TaxID=3136634 RepID=UPI00311D884F
MHGLITEPMQRWLHLLALEKRYSDHTVQAYRRDLAHLLAQFPQRDPDSLNETELRQGVARLHAQGLAPRSLARILATWRGYYQWQTRQQGWPRNPAAGLRAPKAGRPLPKALSVDQTQQLLDRPALPVQDDPIARRDQAMFELFYSSGLRLSELVSLDTHYHQDGNYQSQSWLLLNDREVLVTGKGEKQRRLPVGEKALLALQHWLEKRGELAAQARDTDARAALFLGARGARIHPRIVQQQLEKYAQTSGLPMHVHPHSLRHSFASHLLQSAQDLRAVQELLGHANISTTQIYTRLDFQHLAQAYDQAHPRARRKHNNQDEDQKQAKKPSP